MLQYFIELVSLLFEEKWMCLVFFQEPVLDLSHIAITIVFSIFIAYISYFLKFLTASGSVATFFLASIIYGIGGWKWTVPILTFFVLSSILSKIGKGRKQRIESVFEKTSTRDLGQVAANGAVAGTIVLIQYIFPRFDFYTLYLGTIAAVTADTWGTEIGVWFRGKTILIHRFVLVEPGTSGGISIIGFLGGVVGASIVSMSAFSWVLECRIVIITVLSGVIGSLVDSFLGGLIQARYRCSVCNKLTEREVHCNVPAEFVGGVRWINNDIINGFCAITGMLIAYILIL